MHVLALDLGTNTGWALREEAGITSGTWVLASDKELRAMRKADEDRCCDPRFFALYQRLDNLKGTLTHIYFEDVQFMKSLAQAQLWSGFRGIVTLFKQHVQVKTIPTGTLKKFATGNGAAQKELMAATLEQRTGISPQGKDDNEVDALHLLNFALHDLKLK